VVILRRRQYPDGRQRGSDIADTESGMGNDGTSAPDGFTKGAETYDEAVRHNIAGSERLSTARCWMWAAAPAGPPRR